MVGKILGYQLKIVYSNETFDCLAATLFFLYPLKANFVVNLKIITVTINDQLKHTCYNRLSVKNQ